MFYRILTIIALLVFTGNSYAEPKNPKVAEIENYLTNEGISYLKGRFPNVPVLFNVKVTPLRRQIDTSRQGENAEGLPFFAEQKIDVRDEWDDPSKTIFELIPRIQAINIKILLPDTVKDDDLNEMRENLFENLDLIEGRDRIVFERKVWGSSDGYPLEILLAGFLLVLTLLVGLYFISRNLAKSLAQVSESTNAAASQSASAPAIAPSIPSQNIGNNAAKGPSLGGDVSFNDSLKLSDKIKEIVVEIEKDKNFPSFADILDFDRLANESPKTLASILEEMPEDMRIKLFEISNSPKWFDALIEKGDLSIEAYYFMQHIVHRERNDVDKDFETTLIAMWRLSDNLASFVSSMDSDEALCLLNRIPTDISIPAARAALPGSWGSLLKNDFRPNDISKARCAQITKDCLGIRDWNNPELINNYAHEKGIISYLKTCSVEIEKDIYVAAGNSASINYVRAPFYPILEAEVDEDFEKFIQSVDMHTLALALVNLKPTQTENILSVFSSKMQYLITSTIQALSAESSLEQVGRARNEIAQKWRKFNGIVVQKEKTTNNSGDK